MKRHTFCILAVCSVVFAIAGCSSNNANGSCVPQCGDRVCGVDAAGCSCGTCQAPAVCNDQGQCEACTPESDETFCTNQEAQCGAATGVDACGNDRTVADCGTCSAGTCQQGQCSTCTPEADDAFCADHNSDCGGATGTDRCGSPRTVANCGTCSSGTCQEGQCVTCTPESDDLFCDDHNAQCGAVTGADRCGSNRTVTNCGTCPTGTCQQGVCAACTTCPTARLEVEARDLTVSVDDAGSSDPNGTIASFSWDYGDGTAEVGGPTPPVHTYAQAGAYTITLTVTDNSGQTASASKSVTVAMRTSGSYAPDDATTGVPEVVKDRLWLLDLEKPNKSSTNTPTVAEETLVIGWSGSAYTFKHNGASVTIPVPYATSSSSGLVLDRIHVRGYLDIRAPKVTIRRSIVEAVSIPGASVAAPPAGINAGRRLLVAYDGATTALLLEDMEVRVPAAVQRGTGINTDYHHGNCVHASRAVIRRVELTGSIDGAMVHQGGTNYTDVLLEKSWVHDLQFYDLDADRTDRDHSHNDGIQVECSLPTSGSILGVRVIGNTFDLTSNANLNACIMVTNNACGTNGLQFNQNYCDGTTVPFNVGAASADKPIHLYANGNRFGPNRAAGLVPKTWKSTFTDKVMGVKTNTDGGDAYENYNTSKTQAYVYFSFDPPTTGGGQPPSGEANGNIMVDHARGSQTWGTVNRGTAGVGLW
jgi:PKD repeat protein